MPPTMGEPLPILVAGAGPAGLIMAIALLKNGIPARIIERNLQFHGGSRGTGITPRTLEALSLLGIVEDVFARSTPPLLMALYGPDGQLDSTKEWSQGADASPSIPYRNIASCSQAELEAVLRLHLGKLGGKVEIGMELVGLEQDEDSGTVTACVARRSESTTSPEQPDVVEETILCSFLIGADGARGTTRKLLGVPFLGETKEADRILTANVFVTGASREHWNFWGNIATAVVGLKPLKPEPLFHLQSYGPELPEILPADLEGTRSLFQAISKREDIVIHDVQWASVWRANIRMAKTFGIGRVFLVGDAAHCHSPMGGQGMNSSVQDSVNLAWKLTLAYRGLANEELLKTYDTERIPVIAEMLNLSSELHKLAFSLPAQSTLQTSPSSAQLDNAMYRPKNLLQLGVNYRWSPIVLDERVEAVESLEANPYGVDDEILQVRAGDRAPDAPVLLVDGLETRNATLFNLFDVRRHLIIVFVSVAGDEEDREHLLADVSNVHGEYVASGLASLVLAFAKAQASPTEANSFAGKLGLPDSHGVVHVVLDEDGHAFAGYNVSSVDSRSLFAVVRPDSFIGALVFDSVGVDHYFASIVKSS